MGFTIDENILLGGAVYLGVIVVAFWLAMTFWAYRDMRARTRDGLAQLGVAALVLVLNVPGLFVYLLLRPRETLSEAYERSLEEEALLQEIEEKPHCPGCAQRVQSDWQVCPYCHTRLKNECVHCGYRLELAWKICPSCATPQNQPIAPERSRQDERWRYDERPEAASAPDIPDKWLNASPERRQDAPSLEFIDGDDY